MDREGQLVAAFVEVADSLVDDFDVVDLLQGLVDHSVGLLRADAAGLMLADQRGGLQVAASSTEQTRLLELFQLQNDEGPCLDCFRTGRQVLVADLASEGNRWPQFVPEAVHRGFRSVHALPLRLRGETIGAMNLFHTRLGAMSNDDLRLGQALGDVATISILQQRALDRSETLSEQLQTALNSRVIIEQAKGVLAERGVIDMDGAFACLRGYARGHNRLLSAVAKGVVDGTIDSQQVLAAASTVTRASDNR